MWTDAHIAVHPSHDVWALGVIAYEAITQGRALTSQTQIAQCAQGQAAYPWEVAQSELPRAWVQSRLRPLVEPCLKRDAAERPAAAQIHAAVNRLGQFSTAR